jgi:hypothetical protein
MQMLVRWVRYALWFILCWIVIVEAQIITSTPTSRPTIHSDNLQTNDLIPGVSFIIGLIILITAFVLLVVFIELCVSIYFCNQGQRDDDITISNSNRRLCDEDNNNNRLSNSGIVSNQLRSSANNLESHNDHCTHATRSSTGNIQSSSSSSYVIIGDEMTDSPTMDMKTEEETMKSTLQPSTQTQSSTSSVTTFTYYPTTAQKDKDNSSSSTGKSTSFSSFLKALSMKGVIPPEASTVTVGRNSSKSLNGTQTLSSTIVDSKENIKQDHDDASNEITGVHIGEGIGEEAYDDYNDNEYTFLDILSEFVSIVLPDFEIESDNNNNNDDDDDDDDDDKEEEEEEETIEVDNHHSTLDGHDNGSSGNDNMMDTPSYGEHQHSNSKNVSSSMNPSTPQVHHQQQQQQQQQQHNRTSSNSNSLVGFLLHSFHAVTTTTPSKTKNIVAEQSGDSTNILINENMNMSKNMSVISSNNDDNIDDGRSGLKIDIPENGFVAAVNEIPNDDDDDAGINYKGFSFLDTISEIIASAIPDYDNDDGDVDNYHDNDDIESNKGSIKVTDTGRNNHSIKIYDDESLQNISSVVGKEEISRASTPNTIKRTVSFSSESEIILVESDSVKKSKSSLLRRLSPTIGRRQRKTSSPIRSLTPTKSFQKPKIITK